MNESISFVIPTYRTTDTLPELVHEVGKVASGIARSHRVIVIDDACPEGSGRTVAGWDNVCVYQFESNQGQRTAVLAGLSVVESDIACVMDADFQDNPESVISLVDRLIESGADVVCAGRRGGHQSHWRRGQAWGFRTLRWAMSGGRIPRDAGVFHVARLDAIRDMIGVARPGDDPLVAYVRSGSAIRSIPVQRLPRRSGESSYTALGRAKMAIGSLGGLLRGGTGLPMPELRTVSTSEHI